MKVVYSPLVESQLLNLIDVLIAEEYLYSYPFAVKYVDDLVDYVEQHIDHALTRMHRLSLKNTVMTCSI